MNNFYWIIEFSATFIELMLSLIFCGTFIENSDLNYNLKKRFIISVIGVFFMIFINYIELYSPMTVVFAFILTSFLSMIVYPKNKVKSAVLAIIFLLILNLIDNIIVHTISYVAEISISNIYQKMSLYRIIAIIASKTLLLFFIVVINKLKKKKKTLQIKNTMLEQATNETKETFELIQNSLHDYKHNIIYLQALADNNDIDGIKKCLSQQNDFLGKRLFYYKTGNDTVDAMLYIKQKSAENHNITFIINANIPEDCPVSSEHFAVILGNLLDNATEASCIEENPFIEVRINKLEEYFWIIVANKCINPNISLKTSKPEKHLHGIGLNSVRHIVKHYNGELIIDTENEKFEVKIMIPL